ncbi:MAG: hypothetical protein H0U71_07590 [Gammaproteobacteria bacterium]|nr:hypothetical protein [Gammaproteobacteria bacterium]
MVDPTLPAKLPFAQQYADYMLNFAKTDLVNVDPQNAIPPLSDVRDYKVRIMTAIKREDYSVAIDLLTELMDFKQGIKWHRLPADDLTKLETLVRDARYCQPPQKNPIEPYIIMGINYIRATKLLLPPERYQEIQTYLADMLRNYWTILANMKNDVDIQEVITLFAQFNTVLINNIAHQLNIDAEKNNNNATISFEDARYRLKVAKDFTNLETAAKNIVTVLNLKDENDENVTVFQADCALTRLTPALKSEYENRHIKNKENKEKWFDFLPKWQQTLVDQHAGFILDDDRMITTQSRAFPLPGLRNWYHSVFGVLYPEENKAVVTTDAYHSGTLITLGKNKEHQKEFKKENKRLARLNAEQLKSITDAEVILALTLNTGINPVGNDKKIVEGTHWLAGKAGFLHANLPQNPGRLAPEMGGLLPVNDFTGITKVLSLVTEKIPATFESKYDLTDQEKSFFSSFKEYVNAKEELDEKSYQARLLTPLNLLRERLLREHPNDTENITNLCSIIEVSCAMRFLMGKKLSVLDEDNQNLLIACYTNILVSLLQNHINIAINSSCESGKDRDGLLMFRTAMVSFCREIFGTYTLDSQNPQIQKIIKNNILLLANAKHYNLLPGLGGGGCGTFGVKKDSEHSIPKHEFPREVRDILIELTASYNKEIRVLDMAKDLIYFTIGNTDVDIQRRSIIHVLNIQIKREKDLLTSNSLKNTFKSSSLTKDKIQLLEGVIKQLKGANSIEDLKVIIDKAKEINSGFTKVTRTTSTWFNFKNIFHSEGTTSIVLDSISRDLHKIWNEILKYEQNNPASEATQEAKEDLHSPLLQ